MTELMLFFRRRCLKRVLVMCLVGAMCSGFAVRSAKGKSAPAYNAEGWGYLERGENLKAVFSFKNALNENPRYVKSMLGLAAAYRELEEYDEARELYRKALGFEKKSPEAWLGLGYTLSAAGEFQQAIEAFEKASSIMPDNIEAEYGIAELYYRMGRVLWASRRLEKVLRVNRYHFRALLLKARIKSDQSRLDEARKIVEAAIENNKQSPAGYTAYSEILLAEYLKSGKNMVLEESEASLRDALAVNPDYSRANRLMGLVKLLKADYSGAKEEFLRSKETAGKALVQYHLGLVSDLDGSNDQAMAHYLNALKIKPSDSVLRFRLEDFFLLHNYMAGHPGRVMLSKIHAERAHKQSEKHLSQESVYHLRRALALNPMSEDHRTGLMDYYEAMGFMRFYINQLKQLQRLYPGRKYQDRLTAAIYKRRGALHQREGYGMEEPPRDVPSVLVLNFHNSFNPSGHFDLGSVAANSLTFGMGQFGRMKVVDVNERLKLAGDLGTSNEQFSESFTRLQERLERENITVDYLVYGSVREQADNISVQFNCMDFKKGLVIGTASVSAKGRFALDEIMLGTSRKIYEIIPYSGRILRVDDSGVLVNLGSFDGLVKGDRLVLYKERRDHGRGPFKQALVLTIKETDTFLCLAEPSTEDDIERIDSSDRIFPLEKRRAKLISE